LRIPLSMLPTLKCADRYRAAVHYKDGSVLPQPIAISRKAPLFGPQPVC
jgi:hypothetical protein